MTLPAFWGNSGIKNFSHGLCIRTGHVFVWGTNPLSRLRRHLPPAGGSLSTQVEALAKPVGELLQSQPVGCASCSPFCRLVATSSPSRGKSFHSGDALGKEGRFRPYSSTAERIQLLSCKLFALAKASPFRERWHGGAVTERVSSGTNPLSLAALDSSFPFLSPAATSSPSRGKSFHSGDALGKEGRFRPHSLTAERIQLLSGKHSAFAKASPFRERWHGEAVTERVPPRLTAAFGKRFFHGPAERPSSLESRY